MEMLNTSSEMISNMLSEEDATLNDVQKEFDNRQHLVDFIASYDEFNSTDSVSNELISALKKRFINTSQVIKTQLENLQARMVEQIISPVRWVACIESLVRAGVQQSVECGPGKVLAGLIKRIDKNLAVRNIGRIADLD